MSLTLGRFGGSDRFAVAQSLGADSLAVDHEGDKVGHRLYVGECTPVCRRLVGRHRAGRHIDGDALAYIIEGVGTYLCRSGRVAADRGQPGTVLKCIVLDQGDAPGNRDGGELLAGTEGIVANARKALGEVDGRELRAIQEHAHAYRLDVLGEHHRLERGT